MDYQKRMQEFSVDSLPDLDEVVLAALELFSKEKIPKLPKEEYKQPLVAGSGNAEATGKILFSGTRALFASESTYLEILEKIEEIDGVIIISSSGSKHAPEIAKCAKERGKKVTLITNTENAPATEHTDAVFVYPKNREPYTYNTSTYMGMILARTKEDPKKILSFIKEHVDTLELPDFSVYQKFYLIVPTHFSAITRMLEVKFIELFGRVIARDVETEAYVPHATTVVPSDELFISFGIENLLWGKKGNRLHIPLSQDAGYAEMMAITYYIIGKIQRAHPPYFKEHIQEYVRGISEIFNQKISAIVE